MAPLSRLPAEILDLGTQLGPLLLSLGTYNDIALQLCGLEHGVPQLLSPVKAEALRQLGNWSHQDKTRETSVNMASVQGQCDPLFSKVKHILEQNIASGEELGASICINIDGRNVVDMWGGFADAKRTQPWTRDTISVVWSVSKCVTNLAALMLVDRGLLDPFEKVAKYWPEFAVNGKENIEVRHILSHTSGLAAWDMPMTIEEFYNVPKATERLAKQAPWWEPGTASGYHALSQGHLVGELVRRTTGKSLGQFIAAEISEPLEADFRLGVEENDWSRVADTVPGPSSPNPPDLDLDKNIIPLKVLGGPLIQAKMSLTPEFRNPELGAANGFGNARSVVRILSMISLGGIADGKRFISPETISLIFQEQSNGMDLVIGCPVTFGIGFGLPNVNGANNWMPQGRICYWCGWGGSIVIMDLDTRMTISYIMNRMEGGTLGNPRTQAYVTAIYNAVSAKAKI